MDKHHGAVKQAIKLYEEKKGTKIPKFIRAEIEEAWNKGVIRSILEREGVKPPKKFKGGKNRPTGGRSVKTISTPMRG